MIKEIIGFEGKYGVDEKGNVYSYCIVGSKTGRRTNIPHKMKSYTGKDSPYLCVGLSTEDGKVFNALVHRLVAQAFISNPNNLPEVDHKDDNPLNNNVDNLQWVTRQENMDKVFSHSSSLRNYKIVLLKHNQQEVGYFTSQQAASRYAQKRGASASSLVKYKTSRGWSLESVSTIPQGSSILDENGCEVVPEFGYKT